MSDKECPVCEEVIESGKETSIFINSEESKRGLTPSDVTISVEPDTSITICESCYNSNKHIKKSVDI